MKTKTVYRYDWQGYFAYNDLAYESPLEPNVFPLPADCTEVEPLAPKEGYKVKFKGSKWEYETESPTSFSVHEGIVKLAKDGIIYSDTSENFVADGGLLVGNELEYDKDNESYTLDGVSTPYPDRLCEQNFETFEQIQAAKEKREYVPPTAEEIQAALTAAVQEFMDNTVKARNYDNIATACTYANSTDHVFAAEGIACLKWRDAVWRKCYEMLTEVKAGSRAIPTAEDVIAELPAIEW